MVQYPRLDAGFAALADPTRRGVLELLGTQDASIGELAARFNMTLTGMKKHIRLLEDVGFVATRKVGRVRECALGARGLEDETRWIARYRNALEARMDHLDRFLQETKGTP
jgi:DNA-binding transcriptional ArsR family regulator